jgi:CDP-diglyceride synthetase
MEALKVSALSVISAVVLTWLVCVVLERVTVISSWAMTIIFAVVLGIILFVGAIVKWAKHFKKKRSQETR